MRAQENAEPWPSQVRWISFSVISQAQPSRPAHSTEVRSQRFCCCSGAKMSKKYFYMFELVETVGREALLLMSVAIVQFKASSMLTYEHIS